MTYVGIIYHGISRQLRQIVIPESDADLDKVRLAPGEIMRRMPKSLYATKTQPDLLQAFNLDG